MAAHRLVIVTNPDSGWFQTKVARIGKTCQNTLFSFWFCGIWIWISGNKTFHSVVCLQIRIWPQFWVEFAPNFPFSWIALAGWTCSLILTVVPGWKYVFWLKFAPYFDQDLHQIFNAVLSPFPSVSDILWLLRPSGLWWNPAAAHKSFLLQRAIFEVPKIIHFEHAIEFKL